MLQMKYYGGRLIKIAKHLIPPQDRSRIRLKNALKILVCYWVLGFLSPGCAPPKSVVKEETPPLIKKIIEPDLIIQVSSLDLSRQGKRIEREDIEKITTILIREKVDILAVQGISRYPDLQTRIDFVNELSKRADLRHVFGETFTLSGRQSGHAIFSSYPILSHSVTPFAGIKSINFEAVLTAQIDAGVSPIVVSSTLLPEKASPDEKKLCIKTLSSLQESYSTLPMIATGNLPPDESPQVRSVFEVLRLNNNRKTKQLNQFWYTETQAMKPLGIRSVTSILGAIDIVRFGIFRSPQP